MASRPFIGTRAEGLCLVLFTACTWGLTWPQSKFLLTMLPPFSMRTVCGLAGGAFAFAIAAARGERLMPPRDQWPLLLVYSMLNYGLFVVLTTEALVYLPASVAVTITYTLPIWASILAWPMLGERLTIPRLLAILLGCGGVALMVGIGSAAFSWATLPGAIMGFVAAWLFGLGTVIAKKRPLRLPPSTAVAWQGSIGTIPVLVLACWEDPHWAAVTHAGWISMAYIAALPLSIAYVAWFRALKLVPASTAAMTVLVSPMIGVIGSTLLLGEALGPRQLLALAMTLTGVALAARG